MSLAQKAIKYLLNDTLTNSGLLQVINRGSGTLLEASDEGVLLYDNVSGAYMLGAAYNEKTVSWLNGLDCNLFYLTDSAFIPYIRSIYNFNNILECLQFVYVGNTPPEYIKKLDISEPSDAEMTVIKQNYNMLSEIELNKIHSYGNLYAAHDSSRRMVGFVGCHLEGSMGLLEILPEYRRQGYGTELECFIITRFLEKGLIPFCQVEINNLKSINLQQKLGLKKAENTVYWLY